MKRLAKIWVGVLLMWGGVACLQAREGVGETAVMPASTSEIDPFIPQGSTIVVAARQGPIADGLNRVIPEWEALTGNQVTLLALPYGYLQQQAFTDVLANEGHYDVVFIDDPWLPSLAGGGFLVPFSEFDYTADPDFVTRSLDVSQWPPPFGPQPPGQAANTEERLYALPLVGNVQLFIYRQDILPIAPQTLSVFMSEAQAVADPQNGFYGYAYRGASGNPIVTEFNAWNWSYGGDIFDEDWNVIINQEASVAALTDFIAFTERVLPSTVNYESGGDVINALLDGQALAAIIWPSDSVLVSADEQAAMANVVEVIQFPAAAQQTSQLGNWLLGIPTSAPHKRQAFDFIVWATSRETMKAMAATGLPPTRKSVFEDPELTAQYPWLPITQRALENATWRPRTTQWSKVEQILGNYLVRAIEGELTSQDALDQAAIEIGLVMREAGYID